MRRSWLCCGWLCYGLAAGCAAAEIRVHPGAQLQVQIDAARPGDTLLIERGHYDAPVHISKALTLRGIGDPVIDAHGRGDVIRIGAADVHLQGLVIVHSGDDLGAQNAGVYIQPGADRAEISGCQLAYNLFGLWIEGVHGVRVENDRISGQRDHDSAQRGNGIQLYNTQGALIVGNQISYVRDGIYVDVSHHALFRANHIHHTRYGTHYMNSYYNRWEDNEVDHNRDGLALMMTRDQVVSGNRIWANSDVGILMRTFTDSRVENNVVADNVRGFFLYDAEFNQVHGNLLIDNDVGMHLSAGSIDNSVDGNDFIHNREQIRYVGSQDEIWQGRTGNFWSDYLGWDRNGDGRGDIPYAAVDLLDRLLWRYPTARLLMDSPALLTLRHVAQQFPLLHQATVIDAAPSMRPHTRHWRDWIGIRH